MECSPTQRNFGFRFADFFRLSAFGLRIFSAACLLFSASAGAAPTPVKLDVDATDAPRNLLHTHLRIPAVPGPLTLYYPKWLPGEHMPDGPVNNVADLKFSANGVTLDWQRDPVDMFAFHLTVPPGAASVEVTFDFLLVGGGGYSSGGSATAQLLDLNWNQLLLYPLTAAPLKIPFAATLKLPPHWQYGTALPLRNGSRTPLAFAPVPLETLIDSPVVAGQYVLTTALTPGEKTAHFITVLADDPADLAAFSTVGYFPLLSNLVHQANALMGAHHYRDYHFLLTASDHVAHFGLEHHESSDDRVGADFLTDADARIVSAELLPHEMFHSWNGKYRRPAGLATPDYQQPMRDELLWVYEGLTSYYGKVLATRAGLQTAADFRGVLALNAAMLDHRSGRSWRSLADTTVAAQLLYAAPGGGRDRRRGIDFYPEGDLLWLAVDTRIRQQTAGKKSLDDFCREFYGGENSAPRVVPYNYDDVLQALNDVAPGDWKSFFQQRVYTIAPHAPLGGITQGGWRLGWTNQVPPMLKISEEHRQFTDLNYSLGFSLSADGNLGEVLPGSPADQAGMFSDLKLVAVNGRTWSVKRLRDAVAATTNRVPVTLLTVKDDYYQTFTLNYQGGAKYPVLERNADQPDLLEKILQPRASH